MSRNFQRGHFQLGLSAAIAGILASAVAHAADSGASSVLEEIIVTAQKRSEKLQDVPVAITVVNETQLQNLHVYNITDLARTTPALEMVQAFGGPGGGGQIRGIGTTSFTRSAEGAVGIVVDGVPQGNVNTSNIFDVQRVEVLRGPQGTLFGLTSSAGVINMVTVAPDPTKFESKVHLDYSDKDTAGSKFGEQTIRGVVNVPIGTTSALRVSASGDKTIGVQRDSKLNEDNESHDVSVRARYRLKPSDDFEMNLIADYDKRTQNFSDPQFTYISANPVLTARLAACGITPGYDNNQRCPVNKTDDNVRSYGASAEFDVGVGGGNTFTSITGFRRNDSGPSNIDIMGLPPDPFSDGTQIFGTNATASAHQFSQELRIASPSNQTVEYVAGLFYSDYEAKTGVLPGGAFNVQVTIPIPPPPFTFGLLRIANGGNFTETSNKSTAAFGQMTYHITEQLGLIAGLRYTHQKIEDQASANVNPQLPPPAAPNGPPTFGELTENNLSGRLGVQFKFNADLTAYFTATRGYKGPQVAPAAQGSPSTVIEAELPLAFELGVKGVVFDGNLGIDANIFHTDVKNYQGQRCALNGVGVLVCLPQTVPSVVTKGIEVDLYGQPLNGLTLNGGIIYDIAEYPNGWTGYNPDNLTGLVPTSLSNAQLVGVPKTKFNLAADYVFALGPVQGFLGADAVYKSDMRMGPSGDSRFVYPAHWNTGARLGVRSMSGSWSVTLFGRNLGNDHEPVTIFGGPSFTPPGADPTKPTGYVNGISGWVTANSFRQVGLSLDAKF